MKETVAFYPFTQGETSYINCVQSMIESEYRAVDYNDVLNRIIPIEQINTIYLNWLESKFDDSDRNLLVEAREKNVKIIWVFHNRIPHDSKDEERDRENIKYLMNVSDVICILSRKSVQILKEYDPNVDENKIVFLPHQDFKNMYGKLKNRMLDNLNSDVEMTFACYGLIRPYKNLEIVIRAFSLFNKGKNCRLLIAGKPSNLDYVDSLRSLCEDDSIVFAPEYIPSSMMGSYLDCADVLVMPYDLRSSMNSGAMIMAFSYKKTVITSNITMADDFNDELIYKYEYTDERTHIEQLTCQMQQAYDDGKDKLRSKGEALYKDLDVSNSKEKVKSIVCEIVSNRRENCIGETNSADLKLIQQREAWKQRFYISQMFERMAQNQETISSIFLRNNIQSIALYGYGAYGKRIKNELEKQGIRVEYIIDQRAKQLDVDVPVYTLEDTLPKANHLLITAVGVNYFEICERINKNNNCSIYLLKEFY